jgi:hypothetical protein
VSDNIESSRVMFTAIGDWTEVFRCGFERSNARFNVRFDTPGGNSQSVNITIDQDSSPNVWFRKFSVICESQSVPCSGQSDTVTADIGDGVPKPPVQFGPIPDEPLPARPPTLDCVSSITVDPIYPTEDAICSSDGDPLPDLRFEGLPPGVVGLRSIGGVVLRGSWPGKQVFSQTFFVKVIATTRGWRREETVPVTVNPNI